MKNTKFQISRGFGLIEMVIITAIVTAAFAAFAQVGLLSLRLLRTEKENLEAAFLAQEEMNAMRALRDESWTNNIATFANNTLYYPTIENSKWKLVTGSSTLINGTYTRSLTLQNVYRDAQDKISTTGILDPNTRKITAQVGWNKIKWIQLTAYLTNFQSYLNLPVETKVVSYEGAITNTNLGNFPSNNLGDGDLVQSFTTPAAAPRVTRIDLLLRNPIITPSDIYAEIRTSSIGTVLGTSHVITSSTISTTSAAWVEFRFQNPVALIASTAYSIRLRSIPSSTTAGSGSVGPLHWSYLQTSGSPYAGGSARRYVGKTGTGDSGELLTDFDFGFKVYAQ